MGGVTRGLRETQYTTMPHCCYWYSLIELGESVRGQDPPGLPTDSSQAPWPKLRSTKCRRSWQNNWIQEMLRGCHHTYSKFVFQSLCAPPRTEDLICTLQQKIESMQPYESLGVGTFFCSKIGKTDMQKQKPSNPIFGWD